MQISSQETTIHTQQSVRTSLHEYIDEANKMESSFKLEKKINTVKNMLSYIIGPGVQKIIKHNSFLNFRQILLYKIKEFRAEPYMMKKKLSPHEQIEWPNHNTLNPAFKAVMNETEKYLLNIQKRYLERKKRKEAEKSETTSEPEPTPELMTTNKTPQNNFSIKVLPRRSARLMSKYK